MTLSEFVSVCKSKESRKTCGAKKILYELSPTTISETRAKKALKNFFYSSYDDALFYRSSKVGVQHRRCFAKKQLVMKIKDCHALVHRQFEKLYEVS